ncbi:tryptophan 7-halogenase [Mycolicibacterium boenickei]|uniref:Tryptophan 7-halogenase n=2 Tax=Mycolicibacterium boenickei TaxID=146017 RepID=A0AAX2ZTI1_9MYCO|nr:tryptophan 7-halogenase [Mycolicibacterium boenickei]PEG57996.1 oxidoreductase [Mycolicibacterium boenickei]UNB98177.1 tryptophan 7-halogenase [Mycolicibacterium boenickei]
MSTIHQTSPNHAVVVGGSIAGLCAARVLADHFDRVTLYERDELPDQPVNRSAIPQGQHVHLLMARGAQELEGLFPGLLHDMAASGVPVIRNRHDSIHFDAAGHILATGLDDKYTAYVPSRGHLEWQIRKRVGATPGIDIAQRVVAHAQYDPVTERVTGVVLDDGDVVPADLVVDASGRASRLPAWLQQWGFERPREDSVQVGVTYASHRVKIPGGMMPQKMVIVGATRARPFGMGMLLHEDDIWMVTAFGVAKAEPPRDFAGICALADEVLPPEISAALRAGTPVGEMNFHRYPTSKWRRYERIRRFPTGIVPFGDAIASFNPTFGQGVTMAALQAVNLRRALADGKDNLAWRLAFRNAKTIWPVWMMNGAADHTEHGAQGDRPWWYRPAYELFSQFVAAAETDPFVAEWFLSRTSLIDSLYLVPPPRLIGRAIRTNVKLWLAGRKRREAEADVLSTAV